MIKPVGQAMSAAIEAAKLRESAGAKPSAPVSRATSSSAGEKVATSPAARLASAGAPLDTDKVARIKEAIASGNYPVDADKIADRMVELDLPVSFN